MADIAEVIKSCLQKKIKIRQFKKITMDDLLSFAKHNNLKTIGKKT